MVLVRREAYEAHLSVWDDCLEIASQIANDDIGPVDVEESAPRRLHRLASRSVPVNKDLHCTSCGIDSDVGVIDEVDQVSQCFKVLAGDKRSQFSIGFQELGFRLAMLPESTYIDVEEGRRKLYKVVKIGERQRASEHALLSPRCFQFLKSDHQPRIQALNDDSGIVVPAAFLTIALSEKKVRRTAECEEEISQRPLNA